MKKNAFTLIELLAIIIIIGVIAVITIPKVNDSIEKSRKNISKTNALSYKKAIDEYVLHENMNKNNIKLNGRYGIVNGALGTYQIKANGELPQSGFLTYENNELKKGCLYINKYATVFENGEVKEVTKTTCETYITGYELPEVVTTGDGLYESQTEPGRYIYKGENPNNYIYINEGTESSPDNVLYRIISFEPDDTIKVVRNTSIGNISWDSQNARPTTTHSYCTDSSSYGCNVWANQSNTYLGNNTFTDNNSNFYYQYFQTPSSNSLQQLNEGGTVSADAYLNTYLNPTSTSQENKWNKAFNVDKYLVEHSFNVGGVYYNSSYEGSKGLEKEKQEEKSLTWNGKIGLLNITEFVEASTNEECTLWNNYYGNPTYYYKDEGASSATHHAPTGNNYPCKNFNWIFNEESQWTLSPYFNNRRSVWTVYSAGYYSSYDVKGATGIRPVFYLKSTTKLNGIGTSTNPYTIIP